MKKRSKVIELSSGEKALAEPQFLLEHDGKLYLTVAVREFDPNQASSQPGQARDIRRLKDRLSSGPAVDRATLYSPSPRPPRVRPLRPGSAAPPAPDDGDSGDTFAATDPPT
ncbi:MAG TPA: hypothetical protein VEA61_08585 [Allosphingosinicella sp.]|nr:hypothetical protein [Allosphingosinicella sp.]